MMTYSGDPDEERKRIMAVLLNGDSVMLLDNVSEPLEGDALCSVLTSQTYQDRLLDGRNYACDGLHEPYFLSGYAVYDFVQVVQIVAFACQRFTLSFLNPFLRVVSQPLKNR
jgi:hypothetical protein